MRRENGQDPASADVIAIRACALSGMDMLSCATVFCHMLVPL